MVRMSRHSTLDRILYTGRHGTIKLQLEVRNEPTKRAEIFDIRIQRPGKEVLIVWAFTGRGKREELFRAVAAFGGLTIEDPDLKSLYNVLRAEGSQFIERSL